MNIEEFLSKCQFCKSIYHPCNDNNHFFARYDHMIIYLENTSDTKTYLVISRYGKVELESLKNINVLVSEVLYSIYIGQIQNIYTNMDDFIKLGKKFSENLLFI